MKKFNLEEALAGKPVITRDGRKVTQLTLFETDDKYPLGGVYDRRVCLFTIEGNFNIAEGDHKLDLFMAPEKKSVWVNVYHGPENCLFCRDYYSEVEAIKSATNSANYIKTIEITNEP